MNLCFTNTQLFISQDINWWTGVMLIIVMVLSTVWTLVLTAPIHCRGSDVMLNLSKSVPTTKQTNLHLGWPEGKISTNVHFLWTIPLIEIYWNYLHSFKSQKVICLCFCVGAKWVKVKWKYLWKDTLCHQCHLPNWHLGHSAAFAQESFSHNALRRWKHPVHH